MWRYSVFMTWITLNAVNRALPDFLNIKNTYSHVSYQLNIFAFSVHSVHASL